MDTKLKVGIWNGICIEKVVCPIWMGCLNRLLDSQCAHVEWGVWMGYWIDTVNKLSGIQNNVTFGKGILTEKDWLMRQNMGLHV